MNLSRSEIISGITVSTNMTQYIGCVFTFDSGDYLVMYPFEQTSGIMGELPGDYSFVYNMTVSVSYMGTTTTIPMNMTTSITYDTGGTFSGTTIISGSSPSSVGISGTWADNENGTITQNQTSPDYSSSTFAPYWVSSFGKVFLVPSDSIYFRQ